MWRGVPTPPTLLGIDRDRGATTVGCRAGGCGAPVIDYRPDLGILLIGYLNGKTLCNEDFQRPGVVSKVAAACRALHSGPRFRGRFDMFAPARYLKVVQDNGFRIPRDYLDFADKFDDIQRVLTAPTRRPFHATTTCWPPTSSRTATSCG